MHALLFDFDGLLIDTETPSFEAWVSIYRDRGADLKLEDYILCVGTHGSSFDPVSHLERLTGKPQDREALVGLHRRTAMERIGKASPLPGVVPILREARSRGMRTAVASSSPVEWVEGNLARLGMRELFDAVVCRQDVARVKPHPDLFLLALERLGASPREAVVFEDSLNGVLAAKAAGIFCVAVPNAVTRGLSFADADLVLESLEGMTVERLERQLEI